jgi:hypothetical protein
MNLIAPKTGLFPLKRVFIWCRRCASARYWCKKMAGI